MYLIIGNVDWHIAYNSAEEKNESKYLVFWFYRWKKKEVLKKYKELWDGIKNVIEAINNQR